MKRIIWHWTAGRGRATEADRGRYAFVIEADGTVVAGIHPPEVNAVIDRPHDSATYYAHTRNTNTGAIGIALSAMAGAVERPFNPGVAPITKAQLSALVRLTASLCRQYQIGVTRRSVLSHAEVEPTLAIAQRGKWDISWLPGMEAPGDPVAVGDDLRARVRAALTRRGAATPPEPAPPISPGTPPWLRRLRHRLSGGGSH